MNDNIKTLLELINENPELPVVCMVDSDVVYENYGRWMAQIGRSAVSEFVFYNDRFYDDRKEFTEDYYDQNNEILCERFEYNPRVLYSNAQKQYTKADIEANKEAEARLDKYLHEVADRAFKKAIIVYIDMPDDVEEFSGEELE